MIFAITSRPGFWRMASTCAPSPDALATATPAPRSTSMPTSSPDLTEMHQLPSPEFSSRLKGRITRIASNVSEVGPQRAARCGTGPVLRNLEALSALRTPL